MESSFRLMICFITLNLLLFPLKQFAGVYLFLVLKILAIY